MSAIAIDLGGVEDLPDLMPVMASAFAPQFGEAWTAPQCLGVMAMPGSRLFVARENAPQGFALSRLVLDECELMLLAVAPQSRRGGIGGALLQAVINDAFRNGARTVHLEVRAENPAIALYSSFGFLQVGTRPRYYRGTDGQVFDAATYSFALL